MTSGVTRHREGDGRRRRGLVRLGMALSLLASPCAGALLAQDVTPPAAVTSLTIITVSNDRIGLQWVATGDDGAAGTATTYDIRYAVAPISNDAAFAAAFQAAGEPAPALSGTLQRYGLAGLPPNQLFYVRMKVIDEAGNSSALSNQVQASTAAADGSAPATVSLTGQPNGFNTVQISWTAPGDDGPFGTAAGYDLRRSLAPITTLAAFNAATAVAGEPAPAPAGTPQQMTVGGLTPGVDWYFALRAFDEAGNGSSVPSAAMLVATIPEYLEFGPVGGQYRIESRILSLGALTSLGGGSWRVSGTGEVTMEGQTRSFTFTNLDALTGDTAAGGARAMRVTAGTATLDAAANPYLYQRGTDLGYRAYRLRLSSTGGAIPSGFLKLTLPSGLTSPLGSPLTFFIDVNVEQDLDFSTALNPGPSFWFAPKDYPFRVAPQAGVSYQVSRSILELGASTYAFIDKERGAMGLPGTGCAVAGACVERANDGLFGLGWTLNQYASSAPPAGSIGTPWVDRSGLRATMYLPDDGQYQTLFPAGVVVTLFQGTRVEIVGNEPTGQNLLGGVGLTMAAGTLAAAGGGAGAVDDCTDATDIITAFSAGEIRPGGEIRIAALTPAGPGGFDEIHWGGRGPDPGDPRRGFFTGGIGQQNLSFYAPGTVARLDPAGPRPTVTRHLLAEQDNLPAEGTYAGINVALTPAHPATVGVDTICPGAPAGGHSFSAPSNATRLHLRASGAAGIVDAGALTPAMPFPYMGYDMTVGNFSASFLDNAPVESGLILDSLFLPPPANVTLTFTGPAQIDGCGGFSGSLGETAQSGSLMTLMCWEADFTPWAARFEPLDPDACEVIVPASCAAIDPADLRYVTISSEAPLELEPGTPAEARFGDDVPMDLTPAPTGELACSDIIPEGAGRLRLELEPGYGFDTDLTHISLKPAVAPCGGQAGALLTDSTPRYEARGEILFPYYGATPFCAVVQQGRVEMGAACDLADPPHVSRRAMAGLLDMGFDLIYLEPERSVPDAQKTSARFMSKSAEMDLKLLTLPVSTKIVGRQTTAGPPQHEEFPEVALGFLSDVSAWFEAIGHNDYCDIQCANKLNNLIALDPNGLLTVDAMMPALKGWQDALEEAIGEENLKDFPLGNVFEGSDFLPAEIGEGVKRATGFIGGLTGSSEEFQAKKSWGPGKFEKTTDDPNVKDWSLKKMSAKNEVQVLNFIDFNGFLEFNAHTANTEDDTEDTADLVIGSRDVDLSWAIEGAKAKLIQGTFLFDTVPDFRLTGFQGEMELEGIRFGDVKLDQAGLLLGIGVDQTTGPWEYVAGYGHGKFKKVTAGAGLFLGRTPNLDPIKTIDPDVEETLEGLDSLSGVYARAEASFPILSSPECYPYNLTGGGAAAFWLFDEGPTYGAKLRAYAHGTLACVVHARADLTLLGGLTDDIWHFGGHGFIAGGIGACEPEDWDERSDVLKDDWCFACVLSGQFHTDSESDEFDGDFDDPECD